MDLCEFTDVLHQHPNKTITLEMPGGATIPGHFHITEVAKSTKDFVDCGGVRRNQEACRLQTLVANDTEHRLSSSKLAAIIDKASCLEMEPSVPVEAEVQLGTISLFAFSSVLAYEDELRFKLKSTQTACLATDSCGIGSLPVVDGECCSGNECC